MLEDSLKELYGCLDQFELALSRVGFKPQRAASKKARLECEKHGREFRFRREINEIKPQWSAAVDKLFQLLFHLETYNKIACDLIRILRASKRKYNVDDESYRMVMKIIIVPMISGTMDEQELSEAAKNRQNRRKHFLKRLIGVKVEDERNQDEDRVETCSNSSDSSIDVCYVEPTLERPTENQAPNSSNGINGFNSTTPGPHGYTWEATYILDLLFEALTRHSQVVTRRDLNAYAQIYHIVNITYIVDTLSEHFKELRNDIQLDSTFDYSNVTSNLPQSMRKYEDQVSNNLSMFDMENPSLIFRSDLRNLLIQIRIIGSMLRQ